MRTLDSVWSETTASADPSIQGCSKAIVRPHASALDDVVDD